MGMSCPICNAWTRTLETRTLKSGNTVIRRYECANAHRFSTEERIKDELLRRIRELQPRPKLSNQSGSDWTKDAGG